MIDLLSNPNPHWVYPTVIGAIIGALLPYISFLARFAINHFRHHFLLGDWHSYFYSIEKGKVVFKDDSWSVRRGVRSQYVISTSSSSGVFHNYKGTFSELAGVLYVSLIGAQHGTRVELVFPFVSPPSERRLIGLGLTLDYDSKAVACCCVISASPLTEKQIYELVAPKLRGDKTVLGIDN